MMLKQINSKNKNIFGVIFSCCITMSCIQQNATERFIVPPDTMPTYKFANSNIPTPPPPNRAYYFPSNFIIDTSMQIFFYQQQQNQIDYPSVDWNTPPEFINLRPKDIVQIPLSSIEDFITLNILNKDSLERYIVIASTKDTIQSDGLSKIILMCKEKSFHIRWKFRMITQEEGVVLDHKKRQINYDPDEIKWDSTRIKIPINPRSP